MEENKKDFPEKLIRKFVLGFINLHILYHARKEPIYGKEFKKELKRHGYDISFGTLYMTFPLELCILYSIILKRKEF